MSFGPAVRTIWLLIFSCALLFPLATNAQSRSEQGVYDRLAQIGITPDQVTELNVYPQRDNNDRVRNSLAWIRVQQCPVGWVVMRVGRTGTVTHAYTRDGCEIPGLDSTG